jgi:hypothetical protein
MTNQRYETNFPKVNWEHKRENDIWNEKALEHEYETKQIRHDFLKEVGGRRGEGISAEKEKFIHGLYTGSYKTFPQRDHHPPGRIQKQNTGYKD